MVTRRRRSRGPARSASAPSCLGDLARWLSNPRRRAAEKGGGETWVLLKPRPFFFYGREDPTMRGRGRGGRGRSGLLGCWGCSPWPKASWRVVSGLPPNQSPDLFCFRKTTFGRFNHFKWEGHSLFSAI